MGGSQFKLIKRVMVEQRNALVIVKMFRIFVQMSGGYVWTTVKVGSDRVISISMESILDKVMRTSCVVLEDLGLNKDVLRR